MKDFEPLAISNVRLVDEASRAIREVILTGELPPGSQLRQADIAQKMRISRTPLREALMKLEQEGLIAVLPRRVFRVVDLKLEEAIELYELREMLDGLAARLAAQRAGNDVLEILGQFDQPNEQKRAAAGCSWLVDSSRRISRRDLQANSKQPTHRIDGKYPAFDSEVPPAVA